MFMYVFPSVQCDELLMSLAIYLLQVLSLERLFDSNLSWRQRQELGQQLFFYKILDKNFLIAEAP